MTNTTSTEPPAHLPRLSQRVRAGDTAAAAVPINDHIYLSRGTGDSFLVTTTDGDIVINTGLVTEGPAHRARFAAVSNNPVRTVIFTQGHGNQIGGWQDFAGPGVDIIAHANFADVREYWTSLGPFYQRRTAKLWAPDTERHGGSARAMGLGPEPVPTITFQDTYRFTLGGREVELLSTPGGETTDSLVVWLPGERAVFIGNLVGPMLGHIPNLGTIRGDKLRDVRTCIRSIERVIALEPDILVAGHDDPLRGRAQIAQILTRIRDALQYLRAETFRGMNEGKDLHTLMGEVTLPPDLALQEGHGTVAWAVRAIWETYAGWCKYESTTELYDVPARAVWPDLVDLAGGPDALTDRASQHVAAGRPLEALHLTDIVLDTTPHHRSALTVRRAAVQTLLDRSTRDNLSETRWLQDELRQADILLASRSGVSE